MEAEAAGKKVTLKSSDEVEFKVDEAVAMLSQVIKHMIEDDCANETIPVANVDGMTLTKVIEYCEKRVEMQKPMDDDKKAISEEKLKAWEADYVNVDQDELYHLLLAANYLNIEGLLDLTTQKVADMIKGKSVEEIRKTFKIENDLSPEKEAKIRKDHSWAFDECR